MIKGNCIPKDMIALINLIKTNTNTVLGKNPNN